MEAFVELGYPNNQWNNQQFNAGQQDLSQALTGTTHQIALSPYRAGNFLHPSSIPWI